MKNEINSIFSLPIDTAIGKEFSKHSPSESFIITASELIEMKEYLTPAGSLTNEALTKEVVICLKVGHYYTFMQKAGRIEPLIRNKSAQAIRFKGGDPHKIIGRVNKYEPAEETARSALNDFLCIEAVDNIIIHCQQALLHDQHDNHEMLAMIFVVKDERVIDCIKRSPDFVLLLEKEIYDSDIAEKYKNAILDIIAEKW